MDDAWQIAYQSETAIYDALSRAEDPRDRVPARLFELCDFAGRDVMEIGPGTGRYTRVLAPLSRRWWALELSAAMLRRGRSRCEGIPQVAWVQGSAESVPLGDGCADIVFCQLGLQRASIGCHPRPRGSGADARAATGRHSLAGGEC